MPELVGSVTADDVPTLAILREQNKLNRTSIYRSPLIELGRRLVSLDDHSPSFAPFAFNFHFTPSSLGLSITKRG